jgi:hypothetical protein
MDMDAEPTALGENGGNDGGLICYQLGPLYLILPQGSAKVSRLPMCWAPPRDDTVGFSDPSFTFRGLRRGLAAIGGEPAAVGQGSAEEELNLGVETAQVVIGPALQGVEQFGVDTEEESLAWRHEPIHPGAK